MRAFGALLLVARHRCRRRYRARNRDFPRPSATPSESEALIQRARALSAAGNYRESAAAWQTVGAREPVIASLATRESIRALIAAGDIEPALEGSSELGTAAPSELLLRAADACRAAGAFDCATSLYRRARQAAGRTACGRRGRHRSCGDARAGRQRARSARDVSRASAHVPRGRRLRACRCWRAPPLVHSSATPNRSPKPTTTSSSIASPASRHFAAPSTCRPSG